MDRRAHVARYGGARDVDKYSALDNRDLGAFFARSTSASETVFVFGYSPAAYVYAGRRSASRFFWSRPVILDFNHDNPSYGIAGLAADLSRAEPAFVVLQMHDWAPDVPDSGPFFLAQPRLGSTASSRGSVTDARDDRPGAIRGGALRDPRSRAAASHALSGSRSALALDGRRGLARRGCLDAQRT
jgi:hypothetical protein